MKIRDTVCVFPAGTLFLIAEWYGTTGKANEGLRLTATEIGRQGRAYEMAQPWGRRVTAGPADPSIFASQYGVNVAADLGRQGLRFLPADNRPGSRMNGLAKLCTMLKAGTVTPMEDPGLFVFETCTHFLRTVPVLARDRRYVDDIDTNQENHRYDAARYAAMGAWLIGGSTVVPTTGM